MTSRCETGTNFDFIRRRQKHKLLSQVIKLNEEPNLPNAHVAQILPIIRLWIVYIINKCITTSSMSVSKAFYCFVIVI